MITIVNFKAYEQATGKNALALAKICQTVAKKEKANIAIAVQTAEVYRVSRTVKIPILAQHVDCIESGAHTGWILPETIKEAGAVGSLINHSEHRISEKQIRETVKRLKKLELLSIVCVATPDLAKKVTHFKPDIIAIEPPELIGGKISVSQAKPEIITQTIKAADNIPVICGAGVNNTNDVTKAYALGAQGILVASAIAKSSQPRAILENLVRIN